MNIISMTTGEIINVYNETELENMIKFYCDQRYELEKEKEFLEFLIFRALTERADGFAYGSSVFKFYID